MNILIAPNSMKGSLDALEFASQIGKGFREVSPVFNIREVPVADGGDHTGIILGGALNGRHYTEEVADPLGRVIPAGYVISGRTAVIEMAAASGLRLLAPGEAHPEKAASRGTGELISAALARGCTRILLGAGGSATIDGGIGMLAALGFRFFDQNGLELPGSPGSLSQVKKIETPGKWPAETEFIILADVDNPLLGENGAAVVFGPQKGAGREMVIRLEEGLTHWISLLEELSGKRLRDIPGMGAAGGIAAGLVAFLQGRIVSGAGYIFDTLGMDAHLAWADWVITGEGRADNTGLEAKAPGTLARLATAARKPVTLVTGSYEPSIARHFDGVLSISNGSEPLPVLMTSAGQRTRDLSRQLAAILLKSYPGQFLLHSDLIHAENLIRENHFKKAAEVLDQMNRNDLAYVWYLRGLIPFRTQAWREAINNFRKCLELDPGNQGATTHLTMVSQILAFRNPDLLNP